MTDASVFTWSFILSRTSHQKENRKSSRLKGKVLPPNPDQSEDFEGANDYAIGPPCCELRVITKQQRKNYGTARQDRVEARPTFKPLLAIAGYGRWRVQRRSCVAKPPPERSYVFG